jgi:hypothetical protein
MILFLLWPALALAFTSEPAKLCHDSADCILVQETYCGEIHAVAMDQLKAWAGWEAKLRAKDEAEKKVCPKGPRPRQMNYQAVCVSGECQAVLRAPPAGAGSKH